MPSDAPIVLVEGETTVSFKVFASASYSRRYVLEGAERISWDCKILEDMDIVMSTRMCCRGLQMGVERSREVIERERSEDFSGFVDLSGAHKSWLSELGAASTDGSLISAGGRALLVFDFDNLYSWFTPKTVRLTIKKLNPSLTARMLPTADAARELDLRQRFVQALNDCRAEGQWELSLRLLGRMRQASVPPDVQDLNTAIDVCGRSGHWQHALGLLQKMRTEGPAPTQASFLTVMSACESAGQAELALRVMDDMEDEKEKAQSAELHAGPGNGEAASGGNSSAKKNGAAALARDLEKLRVLLHEVIPRCPADAPDLLASLAASLGSLERYLDTRT